MKHSSIASTCAVSVLFALAPTTHADSSSVSPSPSPSVSTATSEATPSASPTVSADVTPSEATPTTTMTTALPPPGTALPPLMLFVSTGRNWAEKTEYLALPPQDWCPFVTVLSSSSTAVVKSTGPLSTRTPHAMESTEPIAHTSEKTAPLVSQLLTKRTRRSQEYAARSKPIRTAKFVGTARVAFNGVSENLLRNNTRRTQVTI